MVLSPRSAGLYRVYHVTSESFPRQHKAIFVETHESGPGTGHLYQVVGSVAAPGGMQPGYRPEVKPEECITCPFVSKELLGVVSKTAYESKFEDICDEVERPKQQYRLSKRLFPAEKVRRCGEWVDDAVRLLRQQDVLIRVKECEEAQANVATNKGE
jgi:hypothetical protein